jgi:hypothetical protein
MGACSVFWALGVLGAPCGFWVLRLILVGLFESLSFCGLALVVPVYTPGVLRGALHFLIKSSYKKKIKINPLLWPMGFNGTPPTLQTVLFNNHNNSPPYSSLMHIVS